LFCCLEADRTQQADPKERCRLALYNGVAQSYIRPDKIRLARQSAQAPCARSR